MNRKTVVAGAILVVVLVVAIVLVPRFAVQKPDLPHTLGTLQLTQEIGGDQARTIINKMHGKGVTPRDNAIGLYADRSGSATLYHSVYEQESDSRKTMTDMVRGIETGFTPFSNYERRDIEGYAVSFCIGDGQAHYFFANGTSLYWLAADFPVASAAIQGLIQSLRGVPA